MLGTSRGASAPFVVTEVDSQTGALFARNPWNIQFGNRVAFADLGGRQRAWTADRTEFIGRNRTLDRPAALAGDTPLSNRVGAGLDPCGALQTRVELEPNHTVEIVFFLGEAATSSEAVSLISRYRAADLDSVLHAVTQYWDELLGVVAVKSPDRSMDILLNSWLLYQTVACRIMARSAFYQASGAYGFRDQLQDVMALTVSKPDLVREHLLRAAARQFTEGDVQHWWLPHSGQGVRSRISDDRLWLPYAAAHYVEVTGDSGVLDELVPFVEGPALHAEESESFFVPAVSAQQVSLFEHCCFSHRFQSFVRRAWSAAVWLGGLERRHESGRPRRKGGERLAGMVPPRHDLGFRSHRERSWRGGARYELAAAGRCPARIP